MNSLVLGGILKRFYSSFSMDTFSNRLKVQKIIYILQVSGINFGYRFSWYLHGPYSPDLTRDAYQIGNFSDVQEVGFENNETERKFEEIKSRIGSKKEDTFWLEVATSLHLLKKLYPDKSKYEIIEEVKEKGIHFSEKEDKIKEIWDNIKGWLI